MGKNLNFKNWGNSINKLFGGGKKNAGPPPNTSKYSSINTTGFTGGQVGMNNFNSNFTHNVNSTNGWDIKNVDSGNAFENVNKIGTSAELITAGLDATGKATPFVRAIGKTGGYLGTVAQVADNSMKVYKGDISPQRYSYRMVGTATSFGVGTAIATWGVGGSYAGPLGTLVGTILGTGFYGIEYSYDIIAPQIQASYNSFVNNLYSASYNAQFSGR